jgi:heat shock protein HslJ
MHPRLVTKQIPPLVKTFLQGMILIFLTSGCFSPDPATPLKNTYWSLIELNGESSDNADHQPEVHLIFHLNDKSLHGSDGCNRIQASYTHDGKSFRFETIASTRMYCKEGMEQASQFLKALTKTDRIEIQEDHLILYSADIEIARFEAKEAF